MTAFYLSIVAGFLGFPHRKFIFIQILQRWPHLSRTRGPGTPPQVTWCQERCWQHLGPQDTLCWQLWGSWCHQGSHMAPVTPAPGYLTSAPQCLSLHPSASLTCPQLPLPRCPCLPWTPHIPLPAPGTPLLLPVAPLPAPGTPPLPPRSALLLSGTLLLPPLPLLCPTLYPRLPLPLGLPVTPAGPILPWDSPLPLEAPTCPWDSSATPMALSAPGDSPVTPEAPTLPLGSC